MGKKSQNEEPIESPIPFHEYGNGEEPPRIYSWRDALAERAFLRMVEAKHRRLGMTRREFAHSACGMASALLVINQIYGCGSSRNTAENGDHPDLGDHPDGGRSVGASDLDASFQVDEEMAEDADKAKELLSGDEFIFDVQTHINGTPPPPWGPQQVSLAESYIRSVFVEGDTKVAVLSGVWSKRSDDPVPMSTRAHLKEILDGLHGSPRLYLHANVEPTLPGEAEAMAKDAEDFDVAAWKVYPHRGMWMLDSAPGQQFIEAARRIGVKVIAAHRGISGDDGSYMALSSPRDVAVAAKDNPDFTFLTYHSGWERNVTEGPYNSRAPRGVDRLIKAAQDNGIGKDGNVYAELGSTWNGVYKDPLVAGHLIGKLLKHLGPDRIVWGTDSVFTGGTQAQIAAFRAFQIPKQLREEHGYPELTQQAKLKIFGLNAAAVYGVDAGLMRKSIDEDDFSRLKLAYNHDPNSRPPLPFRHYGPRSWREYRHFLRSRHG